MSVMMSTFNGQYFVPKITTTIINIIINILRHWHIDIFYASDIRNEKYSTDFQRAMDFSSNTTWPCGSDMTWWQSGWGVCETCVTYALCAPRTPLHMLHGCSCYTFCYLPQVHSQSLFIYTHQTHLCNSDSRTQKLAGQLTNYTCDVPCANIFYVLLEKDNCSLVKPSCCHLLLHPYVFNAS